MSKIICSNVGYIYILMYIDGHMYIYIDVCVGRDSVVGIATRYRLDDPEVESLWG
jgi:hypothetical protein